MANYQAIVRQRPEVRDFIRHRRWVHRGEVVVYGANTRCPSFSTDMLGFRHSVFSGETLSVADCLQRERYGVVLGSSHLYGFGLAGNENTIPSILGEQFGFPFANVSMPEASSRNLFSQLLAFIVRAKRPPSAVILMSGGDFTSFCFTSIADPVFGSPNLKQMQDATRERRSPPAPDASFQALLAYTSLWSRSIAQLCQAQGIPFLFASDTTFFEKAEPSALEQACDLGVPSGDGQARQFATHKKYFKDFCARREAISAALRVPLAGPGPSNGLTFVDEFHYDRAGTRALADDYAAALEALLRGKSGKAAGRRKAS
jgi:lysophospholipase L1-like esterase